MDAYEPIRMIPAFRHGADTPWGGRGLARLGKRIPDGRTGESLELSALPGLESRDGAGRALPEILRDPAVAGAAGPDCPLLLKLIAAESWLSVQVHPDDAYARAHEDGKRGKTEAWYVLSARPGAEIVLGLRPGTTKETLRGACREGGIRDLLRRVPVRAGEAYLIPAGTVHALGPDVTVCEIQESSDVTYRFYDWDRTDAEGRRRPLHLEKGLDVVRTESRPEAAAGEERPVPGGTLTRLLSCGAFSLVRLRSRDGSPLSAAPAFRTLTALTDGGFATGDGILPFSRGETFLLPAALSETRLTPGTEALIASPAVSATGGRRAG